MSDIADNLLAQYYGIFDKQKSEKSLSIHECISETTHGTSELTENRLSVDARNDDIPEDTETQENDVETVKESSEHDMSVKPSQILEWKTLENDDDIWIGLDTLFKGNTGGNIHEDISAISEAQNFLNCNKTISTILELQGNDSDLYLSPGEDALLDSSSDVSSISKKKNLRKSVNMLSPSTPPNNKIPIYNETFVDLTNAGLTSFPIETAEKYRKIQMLYLENNNLCELPKELFIILSHLQWLDIRNNQLTDLPTSIKSHPSLETILLQGNKIEKLPLELCLVPKLKTLNVSHNPITVPPKDIIVLGYSSILNYLRTEWNKLHPDEPVTFVEKKIEPKLSTILCYESPREKCQKPWQMRRRLSKSTGDVCDLSKSTSIRKKINAYRPSNRYSDKHVNTFLKSSENNGEVWNVDDATNSLCTSCAQNLAAMQCKELFTKDRNKMNDEVYETQDKTNDDRCDGKGTNIAMEQRLYWRSKVRNMLTAQASTIQKITDKQTITEWRRNKQSFSKSMEKVSKRNEDDIPFAIDIEDYPAIRKQPQKSGKYLNIQKQRRSKLTSSVDIDKKIQESLKSLQEFKIAKSLQILTPKSEQKYLETEIKKLSQFQNEIQDLRRYNEMVLAPINLTTD